ncbi:MAG TPA: hypothetical protein VGD23_03990 [Sphingomicrobium sp.]
MLIPMIALLLQAPSPPPPPACTGQEHSQFDFWVGDWTVTPTGKDQPVANSLIEKLYAGCAVRENWMPFKGAGGGSLNNFVDGKWRQTWVDSANSRVEFEGGLVDGKMVLTGFWKGVNGSGKDALIRMTYSKNADGSVRQHGEQSTDDGKSWSTNFDFTYHPKAKPKS